MKPKLFKLLTTVLLLLTVTVNYAQAPSLGTAADFVLFTTVGAVTNSGISQVTGNVGTNSGSSTGFGNVNGVMHDNDGASAQCAADLLIAYNQLNNTIPNFFPAPLLGNGQILNAGVYSISGAATLNLGLTLNAQGNGNALFIFKIQGSFSTGANAKIHLINGAQACNVFWKVEGLVSMATGTTMRGTVIANNAAIMMNTGDTLEGRALSTAGAVTIDGVMAYTPIGCGSPALTGPTAPALASTECYALFSANGAVSNTGTTTVKGDIGTNVGLTTGFDPLLVNGTIHPIPDASTAQCASDLLNVYDHLNLLPVDIELMYPAQFGNNLVLTPHTYLLNAATSLTDTLYLNALGDTNAVFVIKINGALSTSSYSNIVKMNGTRPRNVFWKIEGAVSINDHSIFIGTIVCNNAAMGTLAPGVKLRGRALTTTGALSTSSAAVAMPDGCCVILDEIYINGVVGQGVVECENALQTITVAGGGTTYHVLNGGSVDLIAGKKIRMLYGTHVFPGGYLHAYITPNGDYCCNAPYQMLTKSTVSAGMETTMMVNEFFRIYPNPAFEYFQLEMNPAYNTTTKEIQLFNMIGGLIESRTIADPGNSIFSLTGKAPGIYYIRVKAGDRIETKKIIKQ